MKLVIVLSIMVIHINKTILLIWTKEGPGKTLVFVDLKKMLHNSKFF